MIHSQPTKTDVVPYSTVKIDGCSETMLGFEFISEQPSIGKRRYCNKVLVHECVSVPTEEALDLDKVVLLATNDPCYTYFNYYKSSEQIEDIAPSIELQLNISNLVTGVIITFTKEETTAVPTRLAYRLYGHKDNTRTLLSQGNLFITPCGNPDNCSTQIWTGLDW